MESTGELLIQNLNQLVLYHAALVSNAKNELEKLSQDLEMLMAILKDAPKKGEIFKAWERDIRNTVYDIEDAIDTWSKREVEAMYKKKSSFRRLFKHSDTTLEDEVKQIRKDKLQPLFRIPDTPFESTDAEDTTVAEARKTRQKKTKNIVGFIEEANELINFLNEDSNKLEVASIVGMAGLGKTTLTWKIFDDPRIKEKFPVRIWVNVSNSPDMKNVFRTIVEQFTSETLLETSYEDLLVMVRGHLKERKFLLVLDDIWTTHVWQKINEILSLENHNGKVLVTTRNLDVAKAATSITRKPNFLRFLNKRESWELLQYMVYDGLNVVPPELQMVGERIAQDCDGLPLSIVVIGGILMETIRAGNNNLAIEEEWKKISANLKHYLVDGDKDRLLLSIISLSYENIPCELRNCFIYLGVFCEDANIPVKELTRLWIAEGFIQKQRGMSMEQGALENLNFFINRNLVMVREAKFDGEPKICCIHSAVREICITEAKYENLNLFQDITISENGDFEPRDNVEKLRRLCIHSYVVEFLKRNKRLPTARSFLCFNQSDVILTPPSMVLVTDCFNLLRVYNAKNIVFPKFPIKIMQLFHLRYLTLVVEQCRVLPEHISSLRNLQTLIVVGSSNTLDIKADIWKMRQLRHLKTKATITLRRDGNGEGGQELQTLSRLSPESCTNEVFKKARNLVTLGIQGELDKHFLSFSDGLVTLEILRKLKLVNQVTNGSPAKNPLRRLPEPQNFPPNLKILVVSGTYMHWSMMSVLSRLISLKVLKLKENAFLGQTWEAEYGFPYLESLHIENMSELVSWTTYNCPFPRLKFLSVNRCVKLVEVPEDVCEILETLHMEDVTATAVSSAKAIEKQKRENGVVFELKLVDQTA